jgi:porin
MPRTPLTLSLFLVPALALAAQDAAPPAEPAPREWIGGSPFTDWTRLSGDWAGWRTRLEDAGIEFAAGYTSDLAAAWSGDVRRRSSYATLMDVNVAFNLDTLVGLPRTILYADAYRIGGDYPTGDVGDFQGLSNLQSATTVEQLAELWVETWLGEQFRVKVGKVDFNSEFAFHEIGGEFVNSTGAIVPTIVNYPTYPNPATSVNVFYVPNEQTYVGAAIYDGANANGIRTGSRGPRSFFSDDESDAYVLALEVGRSWTGGESWGSGRVSLGGYHHTASFARFDGNGNERGVSGLWANFEQHLWRENPTEADDQGVGVFVAYGLADDSAVACGTTVAAGLEWRGALPSRDFDVLGFGMFHCDLADDPGAGTPADETAFELLYKVQLTPAFSIKPELQYILHPGGQDGIDDVLVGLLRFDILF